MNVAVGIDPSSGVPLHRQVYDSIRASILSGALRSGERLPPTRALAGALSLSRATVAEAYDQLQAEGYIQGKHGSGTFVAPDLPRDALPDAGGNGPARCARGVLRLSTWGDRISREDYRMLARPGDTGVFEYDFRPHRIAHDSFPWDVWQASVEQALVSDRERMLSYPPSAGHPDLREAIAGHVRRYRAVSCSPDQVVVVNGAHQGFNLLADLVLESGERAAVENPGYPTARLALESRGIVVSRIPVDADGMLVEALARTGKQRLVHVTPSHQEPTGATLSLSRRLALLDLAERTGMLIVEDDYDSEFRYEGRPVESLQGLDRNGLVVYAGTFSKSVLASLRVGFMILPRSLVRPFVGAKSLWDGGTAILEQAALAQFMRSGDFERHIRKMRRLYRSRRDALVQALSRELGDRVAIGERHGGLNMLVMLDLRMSDEKVVERAAEAGVGLRSAAPYYADPPPRPTFLMGFGEMAEEQIRHGVKRLVAGLTQAPSQRSARPATAADTASCAEPEHVQSS
jgi:GntR family transcriptional regulator/MocR family aminotransferase